MQPDGRTPGAPQEWLKRAKSNLTLASQPKLEQVYWEGSLFRSAAGRRKSYQGGACIQRDKVKVCPRYCRTIDPPRTK